MADFPSCAKKVKACKLDEPSGLKLPFFEAPNIAAVAATHKADV